MKISTKMVLTPLIFASAVLSANANDTGTVTISGSIIDSSCVIAPEQLTRTITLADISPNALTNAAIGDIVAQESFDFDVSSCSAGTSNVGIQFSYTPDANNANYLANTGDAEAVLLGITRADNTAVGNGQIVSSVDYDESTGAGKVSANIKAFRVAGDVNPGTINSTATIALRIQ